MEREKTPHICLVYPAGYPKPEIDSDSKFFKQKDIEVEIFENDENKFMALEWVIPTAFIAYILKPYFVAFFSEAGKDHYKLLKNGLKNLTNKIKKHNVRLIAAKNSDQKLSPKYDQSVAFSIIFQTFDNRQLKLLFDTSLDSVDWELSIDKTLSLLIENYVMFPNDILSNKTKELEVKENEMFYAILNKDSREIQFYDNQLLMRKYK